MIRAYKGSTVTQRAKSKGKDLHPNREGNGNARQELRKKEKKKQKHTADRAAYSTSHKEGYTHLDLTQPISGPGMAKGLLTGQMEMSAWYAM